MQPVRPADYPSHPPLSRLLKLPDSTPVRDASPNEALAAWRSYLGFDGPLLLVNNPNRARKLLMQALIPDGGEPVGLPANCRRFLSQAVKASKNTPRFLELDSNLEFVSSTPGLEEVRVVWAQPVGGMAPPVALPGTTMLVDHGLTLPAPLEETDVDLAGAATLWGLHLDDTSSGALITFNDAAFADRFAFLLTDEDTPNYGRALAQCDRLRGPEGLAARQLRVERESRLGMDVGAGLPMAARANGTLALGVPVRIPDEADLATFISYVRNEQVELDWLPEIQPMFYVAFQVTSEPVLTRQTADHLARWVISPLGPDFDDDEITHSVLGILKAAEYTGVRWYTNPGRARWYSQQLTEWYGASHDAYHPAFEITVEAAE